ncbi:MAG: hypothetical protein KI790_13710 [Cyclobacteriaceae bacterium]|nr:hypothetical protein [Cyclobacteriaceae bacterium HetDA_MAG_MS6]
MLRSKHILTIVAIIGCMITSFGQCANSSDMVHVHLQKSLVIAGEELNGKIYFKNAMDYAKTVGVALINDRNGEFILTNSILVQDNQGIFSLSIPKSQQSGVYTLLFYNPFTLNALHLTGIPIVNIEQGISWAVEKESTVDIAFEGDQLVADLPGRVAVKVTKNDQGVPYFAELAVAYQTTIDEIEQIKYVLPAHLKPENQTAYKLKLLTPDGQTIGDYGTESDTITMDLRGQIVADNDSTMLKIRTPKFGITDFVFTPEPGKNYYLKIFNPDSSLLSKRPLVIQDRGTILRTKFNGPFLEVNVDSNVEEVLGKYLVIKAPGAEDRFVIKNKTTLIPKSKLPTGIVKIILTNDRDEQSNQKLIYMPKKQDLQVSIKTGKQVFSGGETLEAELFITDLEGNPVVADASISVVDNSLESQALSYNQHWEARDFAMLKYPVQSGNWYFEGDSIENQELEAMLLGQDFKYPLASYYAENECVSSGLEINGKLIHKYDARQATFKPIILSIPGATNGLKYTSTNEFGEFRFEKLGFTGNRDVILKLYNQEGVFNLEDYSIEIRNATKIRSRHPESLSANLLPVMSDAIDRNRIRKKVESIYYPPPAIQDLFKQTQEDSKLTYNRADFTINMDEYVYLEDMETVIKEIVPYAIFKKDEIRVYSTENRDMYRGTPLKLIDGIPFEDDQIILSMDPAKIQRIDIINSMSSLIPIGNVAQNGVIAFYTREGITAEEIGAQKFNLEGYLSRINKPVRAIEKEEARIPDIRQVIYWDSDIQTNENGYAKVTIPLSDNLTEFTIQVEALNRNAYGQRIKVIQTQISN